MYKTVHAAEADSDFYAGFSPPEKERVFAVLSGKKIKICEIQGNAIIGEEMLANPSARFDVSINCLSTLGKYFRLKPNALTNLPHALRRDLGKMVAVKRKSRIAQFKRVVRLMMRNFTKAPEQILGPYVASPGPALGRQALALHGAHQLAAQAQPAHRGLLRFVYASPPPQPPPPDWPGPRKPAPAALAGASAGGHGPNRQAQAQAEPLGPGAAAVVRFAAQNQTGRESQDRQARRAQEPQHDGEQARAGEKADALCAPAELL